MGASSCLGSCAAITCVVIAVLVALSGPSTARYKHVTHANAANWGPRADGDGEDAPPQPFTINVSDEDLAILRQQLDAATLRPVKPRMEGESNADGVDPQVIRDIIESWKTFDWRAAEAKLNTLPQFTKVVSGLKLHFVDQPAQEGASVVHTLLLLHGWPGSIVEFTKIIPMLTAPDENGVAFRVIAPSMPGYGFSEAPVRLGMDVMEVAVLYTKLMDELLPEGQYFVQGGDWGGIVGKNVALLAPERVAGLHVNFLPEVPTVPVLISTVVAPSYTLGADAYMFPSGVQFLTRFLDITEYFHAHVARPANIGAALSASPASLAAWVVAKYTEWSDCNGDIRETFSMDDLATHLMMYWAPDTATSAIWLYKNTFAGGSFWASADYSPQVPMGYASFPKEALGQPEVWARSKNGQVVHYERMPRGGHFAAWEEPALLSQDFRTFVSKVVAAGSTVSSE